VDFRLLQSRLLDDVRRRVRNGEMTERSLGRITGISQPHIHNVLKGVRVLSPDMADHIMRRLRIDLVSLVTEEPGAQRARPASPDGACRMVEILDGYLGPGHPYPQRGGRMRYPFAPGELNGIPDPAVVRLALAPECPPEFDGCGLALLDRSPGLDIEPDQEAYFALDLGGAGAIGRMPGGRAMCRWKGGLWESLETARPPFDLIRGRVRFALRRF
jgi:hypothetical protein